jgi:hypothetical protein
MWDRSLEPCFNAKDTEFAFTPGQIDAVLDWVRDLRSKDRTWHDARDQIEAFMKSKNANTRAIKRQVERARELVRPWLI